MVFIETPLGKAWEAYDDSASHRFFTYSQVVIMLVLFELFLWMAQTEHLYEYTGEKVWMLVSLIFPARTTWFSLGIIGFGLYYCITDWMGIKNFAEKKADREKAAKDKKFKPAPKGAYRPNWYYLLFQLFEGLIYGSLMFALLKWGVWIFMLIATPDPDIPIPLDASISMQDIHSNPIQDLALAFGGGFYEELIFRGFLFWWLVYAGKKIKFLKDFDIDVEPVRFLKTYQIAGSWKDGKVLTVILTGCLIYSLSHYLFPWGDTLSWYSFLHRFFFGLIMYAIFVNRKFPVAAWTHAVYMTWYFIFY
ncbi:type II CAAX prenyl endopeptidase Rce1 family protein [Pontibacter sp. G13]|uniref:CPBP family glutamic-type intramembrane protease n=1 Tax=Pontibacter sp. G13 TaxID=3074898 RepID=UPI00288C2BB1|nr:CPBP family glutamic-type intramembrane protease [Pontibacter sp. G13]WNJ19724.1 CPBP family glutamic-type intramembrane protease [Pontibacter sp. G13]